MEAVCEAGFLLSATVTCSHTAGPAQPEACNKAVLRGLLSPMIQQKMETWALLLSTLWPHEGVQGPRFCPQRPVSESDPHQDSGISCCAYLQYTSHSPSDARGMQRKCKGKERKEVLGPEGALLPPCSVGTEACGAEEVGSPSLSPAKWAPGGKHPRRSEAFLEAYREGPRQWFTSRIFKNAGYQELRRKD